MKAFVLRVCTNEQATAETELVRRKSSVLANRFRAGATQNLRSVLVEMLQAIASTGDSQLTERILRAAHDVFDYAVELEDHSFIIHEFVTGNHLSQALTWLQDMPNKPGAFVAPPNLWDKLLCLYLARGEYSTFSETLNRQRHDRGLDPHLTAYEIELQYALDQKERLHIQFIQWMTERIQQDVNRTGLPPAVHRLLEEASKRTLEAELVAAFAQGGEARAKRKLKELMASSFKPSAGTMRAVAQRISTLSSIRDWEALLGVNAEAESFATVMRNAEDAHNYNAIHSIYREFMQRHHFPTAAMVYLVIDTIITKGLRAPGDKELELALGLHRDYIASLAQQQKDTTPTEEDLPRYELLIRTFASLPNPSHFATALSLLEELRACSVPLDYTTTSTFVNLFMRKAPDVESALKVYKLLVKKSAHEYALDQRGFQTALDLFCKRMREPSDFAFDCVNILADAYRAGYTIATATYMQIFTRAARISSTPNADKRLLALALRRAHQLLSMDPGVRPDTALWNALMRAYRAAGCRREAHLLWELLVLTRQADNASVRTVVEMSEALDLAHLVPGVYEKARRVGVPLDDDQWAVWIRGCAKRGRVDDAVRVMCVEMPKQDGKRPTSWTVSLVLSAAAEQDREAEIRERIRELRPELLEENHVQW